jgi:hypothetical protein
MRGVVFGAVFLLLILPELAFYSQEEPLAKIVSGFSKYLTERPQEKVYVHFDRPYYVAGETIWLKAYLTSGPYHEPSTLSRVIYVDLLDKNKHLVQRVKLLTTNGSAAGSIDIPDSITSQNYLVRAYTNWMRNGSQHYFFHRQLKIWNGVAAIAVDHVSHSLDLQFFPEGGDLVDGVFSKVAYKAIGSDGLGKAVSGKIVDGSTVVTEFKSNTLGMGVLYITANKHKKYKAVLDSSGAEFYLPAIREAGISLSVNYSSKSPDITVKLVASGTLTANTAYILAQTRGIICFSARVDLSTNIAIARIPKRHFPSGLSQITIIDQNGQPISERLVFIDHRDHVRVTVVPGKVNYRPREMVVLDIQTIDALGQPVIGDFSMTVYDSEQVVNDNDNESITSYLLLSSELQGYIESPGYYFNAENTDRLEALDYLLLTQGWRRFTLKEALTQDWETPGFGVEHGLTIKGNMVDLHRGKAVAGGKVSLLTLHPLPETLSKVTNQKGQFEFNDIIYFDSIEAILQGQTKNGSKSVKILLDNMLPPVTTVRPMALIGTQMEFERAFITKSVERKAIDKAYNLDDEKVTMLESVEIEAKREDSQNINPSAFGGGTARINVAGNPSLENQIHPLQLVQGRVAGVHVTGGGQNWNVVIQGVGSIKSGITPLIMIDDVPVAIESLHTLSVQDIARYTVWKGPDAAIFGSRGANGAIGFYTKRGDSRPVARNEGSITYPDIGFWKVREFYMPRYDVEKPEHVKPDRRATLFWAPLIKTDSSGRATIQFYNHDLETRVRGVIEGISATGISGSGSFEYHIRGK